MTVLISKSSSFHFALLLSTVGYLVFLATTGNYFVSTSLKEFEVVTKEMDNHKQKIIMMGLLAESELSRLSSSDPEAVNSAISPSYDDKVYSVGNESLNLEEAVARKVMHQSIRHLSRFINNPNILLIYRSFSGEKIILQRPVEGFEVTPDLFGKPRCIETHLCTKYSFADQLSDRIVVSNVYTDAITGRPVISIASPISKSTVHTSTLTSDRVVGEYIVDIYLDTKWVEDKTIDVQYEGRKKYVHIRYQNYWLNDIAFTRRYVADNMTIFVYSYPMTKLLSEHLIFFAIMFFATFFLHLKVRESNVRRSERDSAISNATVDELTGLFNRKVISSHEFKNALAEAGCAVIAIDGNSIKAVNDQYGHHAGDEAIKHIASSMKNVFRKSDFLIRIGGDEFVAILPGCSHSRATELTDTLQKIIKQGAITSHRIHVSIACGVTFKELHEPLDHALARADERLYEHKSEVKKSESTDTTFA